MVFYYFDNYCANYIVLKMRIDLNLAKWRDTPWKMENFHINLILNLCMLQKFLKYFYNYLVILSHILIVYDDLDTHVFMDSV